MTGITRREWLAAAVGAIGVGAYLRAGAQTATPIVVYKDPNCGCCSAWVAHMKANGFQPSVHEGPMDPVHARYRIPASLQSCHTAVIGTTIIEGHVPASDVMRFLREKPAGVIGLTIPGMPASAPGMDVRPFQPFTVLAFDATGKTSVFAKHDKASLQAGF
jgi:hypothetical protein